MIQYTDHNGQQQFMGDAEIEAIERYNFDRQTIQQYMYWPAEFAEPTVPFSPLMEARPGKTDPWDVEYIPNGHMRWQLPDMIMLLKLYDEGVLPTAHIADRLSRTASAVLNRNRRLRSLINESRLTWDGVTLRRGTRANVYQWPLGFRNKRPIHAASGLLND
jgi:hypothetical protein